MSVMAPVPAGEKATVLMADAWVDRGVALHAEQQDAGAIEALRTALRLNSRHGLACYNLGNVWRGRGNSARAAAWYRAAIARDATFASSHYNLGCVLLEQGHAEAAVVALRDAAALRPEHAPTLHNLGEALRQTGAIADARDAWQRALTMSPHPVTRYALACMDLADGHWHDGWAGYEARWAALGWDVPFVPLPLWRGEAVPAGSRLLLHVEQGMGNTLQFMRFIPLLRERFDTVALWCDRAPLLSLLRTQLGHGVTVFDTQIASKGCTHRLPMMSLGHALGVDDALLARCQPPYLNTRGFMPINAVRQTVTGANESHTRHFGLAWRGASNHPDDARRSLPLRALTPLFELPCITWHSLQKDGNAELAANKFPVRPFDADEQTDFAASAELIAGLDGVVSVDTAVAHLAGALNRPVELLLCADADWRWQRARADTPWYPRTTLHRQRRAGDWSVPVRELLQTCLDSRKDTL